MDGFSTPNEIRKGTPDVLFVGLANAGGSSCERKDNLNEVYLYCGWLCFGLRKLAALEVRA